MDRHRLHQHHHPHQRHLNPEFVEPRYLPIRPHPPPPLRPFPDNPSHFHPPQPPHRHLPPPPQQPLPRPPPINHSLTHRPPPPVPCIIHHAPPPLQPSISHQHYPRRQDLNFINSPLRHHHHHQQHRRQLPPVDDDPDLIRHPFDLPPSPNPRVTSNRGGVSVVFDDDRHRFHLPEPPRVPPVDAMPLSNDGVGGLDLDYDRRAPIHRLVNLDRRSPLCPPFREIDDDRFRSERDVLRSPSRFRKDLSLENPGLRLHPDDFRDRRDDRRITDNVERDGRRVMGNVERDDKHYHHEQYHPEVFLSEFDLDSGSNECIRGPVVDEFAIRGSRDDAMLVENVNARRGIQPRSRDVSRSPIKFRNRGIDMDDGFYEQGVNRGSESGRYADRGRREEMQDYTRSTPRKNLPKKSAFLRIQPLKHTSSSNRYDTTPSPHKGKESLEYLDHKSSQERGVSPVELDVSFKSNALVAKAIMGNPSSSPADHNENSAVNDLDTRIGSESPSKIECVKNCENNSPLSRKEEKHSESRVRISPVMKRVGRPSNVEVCHSNAESSSSGSSILSRGSVRRGLKVQISDKNGDKLSALNAGKRRKSIIRPSRLSGSVPAKTDAELLNMDNSQNQPSSSCIFDKCIKKSDEEFSSGDQVIGPIENETIEHTVKFDLNEPPIGVEGGVMGHAVSEASFPKKMRNSPEPKVAESPENSNGIVEDMQRMSNSDEDVTKSVEKCSSGVGIECNGSKGQDVVPLLVDHGSRGGSPEPVACLGRNLDSIDAHSGKVNKHNAVAVANATSSPVDVSNKTQEGMELTGTVDKLGGTKVVLSSEIGMVGQSCESLDLDKSNNQSESRNSGEFANLGKFSNIDVYSYKTSTTFDDDLVSVDSKMLTTASDINPTNDTEEQECQGAGTTSVVVEAREESSTNFDLLGCGLTSFSVEKDISLSNRKRKAACTLESLDSGVSESFHESAVGVPVKDSDPVEKMSFAVSSFPCFISESNVLHSNELMETCLDSIFSMNHGCDSDPNECYPSCTKKQKILSLEPVSSDALVSENCDLPAAADALISMVDVPMDFVENSRLSAVVIGLPNSILTDKNVTGGATDSLLTCSFVGNSKSDFLCGDSCLSVKEIAHPDDKQSSFLSKSSEQEEIVNIKMSESGDRSRLIALESEDRMAANLNNASVHYLGADLSRDSDNEVPVTDMASENNITVNGISPSLSDSPQLCGESTYDGLTANSSMMDTPSDVSSAGADCLGISTLDMSDTVSAVNAMSEKKRGTDDKGSSPLYSSLSNSLLEGNEMNLKPVISASKSDQQFVQKTVMVPSKNANNTITSSNALSRRLAGRNVVKQADVNISTVHASSVITSSNKAPSTYPAKPRTWHRSDNPPASSTLVKKPFVGPAPQQRPPFDKAVKFQGTSYIRKGNSLVRNPVSGAATQGPHVFGVSINQSKPNGTNRIGRIGPSGMIDSTVVHDCLSTEGRNTSIEIPKTPPLPCSGKASNCDIVYSGDFRFSPPVASEGMDNEEALKSSETALHISRNPRTVGNRNVEDAGTLSDGNLPASSAKRIVYIKRKLNQLIASSNSPDPCVSNVDKTSTLSSDSSYHKRRKNQLIRASSESNIHQMVAVIDDSSSLQPQKASNVFMSRSSTKRHSNKVKPPKVSLVWKLGDRKSSGKVVDLLGCGKLVSHLLPWKRATYWRSVWRSSGNVSNCSSMKNFSRKFLSSRKRAIVYVRSGHGFSLRRSKVISVAGSSLKWSKSMERRSKKLNEEVANAVAAVDAAERNKMGASSVISRAELMNHSSHKPGGRIFRIGVYRYRMDPSRRTLQRIPDEELSDSVASKPAEDARKTYVPKRLLIGSDEYVRIGNGNQLVRDPKRRTRILASEKIRWSLHTARTRLAKKRKFCQFFTRFGKCNKGEGKCPFIHDPSKIAVCTKFLNGLCGDPNCKLTHKVIPERMPDCSFFLQGLCSNENCPYRHVNVNPKAPICESFLRGYCAEGNECRKKHSYSCPEYEATGSCPQGSKCKLYHPNKGKVEKRKTSKDERNSRRRYFGSGFTAIAEPETEMAEKLVVTPKNDCLGCQGGDLGDYVSLYTSDNEAEESLDTACVHMISSEGKGLNSRLDDVDELIKPLRLLDRH